MLDVLWITLPVFIIIAIGYGAGHFKFFPDYAEDIFTRFVFYMALPVYLFKMMATAPLGELGDWYYISAFALSLFTTGAVSYLIASLLFKHRGGEAVFSAMAGSYTNAAFVGIPIMVMVFGSAMPVVMVVVFQLTCVMTTILVVLDVLSQKKQEHFLIKVPKTLIRNPIILAVLAGILVQLFVPILPDGIMRFCDFFGAAAIPLALFSLGLSLQRTAQIPLPEQHRKLVWVLSAMKLVIHPFIAAVIGVYLFHLSEAWLKALILAAAMPTAVNHYIVAQKYGYFAARAGRVVFITSIGSLVMVTGLLLYWQ